MKNWLMLKNCNSARQRAQVLVLFAIMLLVMIVFMGMAVDAGNIYVTKAEMSKAVDAAALAAVRNLALGTNVATQVAQNMFAANYHGGGNGTSATSINYTTDANSNLVVNFSAAATVDTYFIRLWNYPRYVTFNVAGSAQSTRANLIMSLCLDRSGSMSSNGGGSQMPGAVTTFVNMFDNAHDQVGMVSFATTVTTDVGIPQTQTAFKTNIINAVNGFSFSGATFSCGGLSTAKAINLGVTVPAGQNTYRAIVFFTDGYANMFQGYWTNQTYQTNQTYWTNATTHVYNVGGYWGGGSFSSCNTFGVFNNSDGSTINTYTDNGNYNYNIGTNNLPYSDGYSTMSPAYKCPTNFWSQVGTPVNKQLLSGNVYSEAYNLSLQVASQARAAGITVYSIGLGSGVDVDFLRQIANDPAGSTYNTNQPQGVCVVANTSADLQRVFQIIASQILSRLTQ